jgi:hypothetical protein
MKAFSFKVPTAVLVAAVIALSSLLLLKVAADVYDFDISAALMSPQ